MRNEGELDANIMRDGCYLSTLNYGITKKLPSKLNGKAIYCPYLNTLYNQGLRLQGEKGI